MPGAAPRVGAMRDEGGGSESSMSPRGPSRLRARSSRSSAARRLSGALLPDDDAGEACEAPSASARKPGYAAAPGPAVGAAGAGATKVAVAVRCRGLSAKEEAQGGWSCVQVPSGGEMVISRERGKPASAKPFRFDFCYGPDVAQEAVFADVGRGVVESALGGYNASVFAYGQTGSGKTYTMLGGGTAESRGLIPRICDALVQQLEAVNLAGYARRKLEASYLEIYNENCIDLLCSKGGGCTAGAGSDAKSSLRVREHPTTGPYVCDLTQVEVTSLADVERLMAAGSKARTVAATNMNATSSRSHAILTLVFTQTRISEDLLSATDTVSKDQPDRPGRVGAAEAERLGGQAPAGGGQHQPLAAHAGARDPRAERRRERGGLVQLQQEPLVRRQVG